MPADVLFHTFVLSEIPQTLFHPAQLLQPTSSKCQYFQCLAPLGKTPGEYGYCIRWLYHRKEASDQISKESQNPQLIMAVINNPKTMPLQST